MFAHFLDKSSLSQGSSLAVLLRLSEHIILSSADFIAVLWFCSIHFHVLFPSFQGPGAQFPPGTTQRRHAPPPGKKRSAKKVGTHFLEYYVYIQAKFGSQKSGQLHVEAGI